MLRLATYPLRILRALLHRLMPVACYIMWEQRYLPGSHKFKIGISREPVKRNKELKRDLHSGVVLAMWLPMPFAYAFEQKMLHLYRRWRTEMPNHAGQTEWREFCNPISATLAGLAAYAYGGNIPFVFVAVCILPLPLDIMIVFFLAAAFWYALFAGILAVAAWALLNFIAE